MWEVHHHNKHKLLKLVLKCLSTLCSEHAIRVNSGNPTRIDETIPPKGQRDQDSNIQTVKKIVSLLMRLTLYGATGDALNFVMQLGGSAHISSHSSSAQGSSCHWQHGGW